MTVYNDIKHRLAGIQLRRNSRASLRTCKIK